MGAKAQKIYNDFVAVQAPKEVSHNKTKITVCVTQLNTNYFLFFFEKRWIWMLRRDSSSWRTFSQTTRTPPHSIVLSDASSTWWNVIRTFVSYSRNSFSNLFIPIAIRLPTMPKPQLPLATSHHPSPRKKSPRKNIFENINSSLCSFLRRRISILKKIYCYLF